MAMNADDKLTVIIPSFNEENNIEQCLQSVSWADEILVVDSYSNDRTLDIARKYTDRILQHEYIHSAAQKNWTIPQAKYGWILLVDCDEIVTDKLRNEIRELLRENPVCDGYWIYRHNYVFGKRIKYTDWGADRVLRLFRRDLGRYDEKRVHAEILLENTGTLKSRLVHYSINDMASWVAKVNRYSTWKAEDKFERQTRLPVLHLLFRPPLRFLKDFILRFGILDGWRGFLIAAMASYAELITAAKLTQMTYEKKRQE